MAKASFTPLLASRERVEAASSSAVRQRRAIQGRPSESLKRWPPAIIVAIDTKGLEVSPRLQTAQASSPGRAGQPQQIVLLLHGYGSNGADPISLAPHWQQGLPDTLFLAPNAPQRCGVEAGYQWWPLAAFTPEALAQGVKAAAPAIDAFIDRKLDQYGLSDSDLAIVGFSQGTMMALHVGLRRAKPVAAVVRYSGMLTGVPELSHASITKPPVLLVHGSADPVVTVAALHAAKCDLEHIGIAVTAHVSNGFGHTVNPVGLRMGGEFVAAALHARGKTKGLEQG